MKDKKYIGYDFHTPVEGDSKLSVLFNSILKRLNCIRIMSCPHTFYPGKQHEMAIMFYNVCLCELYFHGVVNKLTEWKTLSQEYQKEFGSSWKYYAASRRLELIEKYGGEDSDYNEDGSIKTEVGEETLASYSILHDLVHGGTDIVTDTVLFDLSTVISMIETDAKFDVIEVLSSVSGVDIPTYREDADGNIVKQTWVDNALVKAEKEDKADVMVNMLSGVVASIQCIVCKVKSMDAACDNKEFFPWLDESIDRVFDLDFIAMYKFANNEEV